MKQRKQSMRIPKPDYLLAGKACISAPQLLLDDAATRQRQLGFSTFSDYLQKLMRDDTAAIRQVAKV